MATDGDKIGVLNRLSIRAKILGVGIILPALLMVALFTLYYRQSGDRAVDSYVEKARAINLTAESTREQMEKHWKNGVFTPEMLRAWADEGDLDKVVSAVPVVTAWRAAMEKAKEGGYEFRVPKFQPRNPDNQPDELESRALRALEGGNLDEYYEIDTERNAIRYFRPVKLTEACLLCHGDPSTSQELWANDRGLDPTGARMEGWKVGEVHGAFEVIQSLDAADAEVAASMIGGAAAVVVGFGAIAVLFFFIIRSLVERPIHRVVEMMKDVAQGEGDLTKRIDVRSQDETGQLASWFNTFISKLHDVISTVSQATRQLAATSTQVASSAEEMARGSEEQSNQTSQVTAAVEEISATIIESSKSAGETANLASLAAEAAGTGGEVVRATIEGMGRIAESARVTTETIQDLANNVEQIGRITAVIDDIADQTNLLALNAAIEAARAGEQGRGFAVVADEVRKLAERTTKATSEITDMIKSVTARSDEAVTAMENAGGVVQEGRDLADKAGDALREILDVSRKVQDMIGQIATATDQQSSASEEVSKNIESINTLTRENTTGATEAAKAAEDLSRRTEDLQTLVGQFKLE